MDYLEKVILMALMTLLVAVICWGCEEGPEKEVIPTEWFPTESGRVFKFTFEEHEYLYFSHSTYEEGGLVHSASCPGIHVGGGE